MVRNLQTMLKHLWDLQTMCKHLWGLQTMLKHLWHLQTMLKHLWALWSSPRQLRLQMEPGSWNLCPSCLQHL